MSLISRRTVLKFALATPLTLGVRVPAFAARGDVPEQVLIVCGLTPSTTPEALTSVLQPLIDQGIPVTVPVDPDSFPAAKNVVNPALKSLLEASDQLIDIIPLIRTIPTNEPYFQGRVGHDVRDRFSRLLAAQGASQERLSNCTSLAMALEPLWTDSGAQVPAPIVAAPGFRAAGFRTVLQLYEAPLPQEVVQTKNGVLTLSGGPCLSYDPTRDTLSMIESSLQKKNFGQISLYLEGVTNDSSWAGLAQNAKKSDSSVSSLAPTDSPQPRGFPVDLTSVIVDPVSQHRHNFAPFSRLISAAILRTSGQAPVSGTASRVAGRLKGIGLPVSLLDVPAPSANGPAQALLITAPQALLPIELPLDGVEAGIDADGNYLLGAVRRVVRGMTQDEIFSATAGDRDIVLAIDDSALDDPRIEGALVGALVKAREDGKPRFLTLEAFAANVLSQDPVIQLAADTRNGRSESQTVPEKNEQTDALMEDAKLAWRYIDRFTMHRTGLCMANAQVENGYVSSTYDSLAMWDVGSQLQGIRAAHRLGIIDHEEFVGRAKRVIENLPHTRIAGRILPCGLVRASNGRVALRAFYPSDVGRLLSAMALLRQDPALKETINRAVGRWQLDKMVRDGRLQEVINGHESEFFVSQGAHYAARAFAEFGIEAQSPYPERGDQSEADWKMHLLYAAGDISPLGPEPLLQEGIEMGFSAPSAYLADVLFAAQLRSFQATGQIVCPSESPIERSPWFVYEGLRIAASGPRWSLQSDRQAVDNQPGEARKVPLLASTKAAFMWHAVHPHPYSMRMLDYVRSRARVPDAGFAAGIYVESGEQTRGYVDLNTNGVILSAIDYILNPPNRTPLN